MRLRPHLWAFVREGGAAIRTARPSAQALQRADHRLELRLVRVNEAAWLVARVVLSEARVADEVVRELPIPAARQLIKERRRAVAHDTEHGLVAEVADVAITTGRGSA